MGVTAHGFRITGKMGTPNAKGCVGTRATVGARRVDQERKGMHTDSPSPAGPAERTIPKTGAQIIVDALLAHGVDTVFGYIGASVLPLFDRLYESPIRFIVPCHEQGGSPHGRCLRPRQRAGRRGYRHQRARGVQSWSPAWPTP